MTHTHNKSKGIAIGVSRPTENFVIQSTENKSFEKRVNYWIERIRACDRTSIGSYEMKSNIFVELINSVKKGEESQDVAETVVRRMPLKISIDMALKKLGEK